MFAVAYKKCSVIFCLIIAIALAAASFILPQSAQAHSWTQTNTDGFNDANNSMILGFVEFNDMLYAAAGNIVDGTKIYRSSDGKTWTQCNTTGFGSADNGEAGLIVYNNTLYALTMDEIGPNAAFELWKTTNGTTWKQVSTDGFGDAAEIGSTAMTVFNDKLYIGTSNLSGASVFRINSDDSWDKVASTGFGDAGNLQVFSLSVFDGNIYAGTSNANGAEIWRSSTGTKWVRVANAGFGDATNLRICSLFYHKGYIYAGTMNGGGMQVWRSTDGENWAQTGGDGFGDTTNIWVGMQVAVVDDIIYLGTRKNPPNAAEFFISTDGSHWDKEGNDGFGDANNYALYSITFNGQIYLGFSNPVTGAEIWRSQTIDSLGIITDSLPEGTKNSDYSADVSIVNATEPGTWSISEGSLPAGLALDVNTGTISGKPTEAGEFTFNVTVIDSGAPQQLANKTYTLKVNDVTEVLPETGINYYRLYDWLRFI